MCILYFFVWLWCKNVIYSFCLFRGEIGGVLVDILKIEKVSYIFEILSVCNKYYLVGFRLG